MPRFPVDAPLRRVVRAFEMLGFVVVRDGNHISMRQANSDGSVTPLTLPNHVTIEGSTLRSVLSQIDMPREQFMDAYARA